jgi:stage V sporulation protein K
MKTPSRKSAVPDLLASFFPETKLGQTVVDEGESHSETIRAFHRAVRRARKDEVILLPPGSYPAPDITRTVAIRALRPGTVRFDAQPGNPALALAFDGHLLLSGISFHVPSETQSAIVLKRGTVILTECHVWGGIEITGSSSALHLHGSWTGATPCGIESTKGATLEVSASSVTGCRVGITAVEGSKLSVLHSRIEGSAGPSPSEPGAGIHAEDSAVCLAGNLIAGNQIGVHLVKCRTSDISYSRFEQSGLVGLMASDGGPLKVHGCSFAHQASNAYAHIVIEGIDATISHCSMDGSSLPFSQSGGGKVHRIVGGEKSGSTDTSRDQFGVALDEIRNMIGHDDAKAALENVLHQAHASVKRQEQGVPVLRQKYHMVFEGSEGTGRRRVASLLAKALNSLGVLTRSDVTEAHMDDLMLSNGAIPQLVKSVAGGILLLHAPTELDRRDPRLSFSRSRDVLQSVLAACSSDTMLIFTGEREFVRPVLRGATEGEQIFHAILRFRPPSPPELAQTFEALCSENKIQLTTRASEKILLVMHMLDDRRDKRFHSAAGIVKLFELTHKRYLERCSRERRFDIPLESGDIESPIEKSVEAVLAGNPAFVRICPSCAAENPWMPGLPDGIPCASCGHIAPPGRGIWLGSAHYRRVLTNEDAPSSSGLPPLRRRAHGVA